MLKKSIFMAVLFILLLGGCAPASQDVATPTAQPEPTSESLDVTETAIYTDSNLGFSLNYPANWFLNAGDGENAINGSSYSVSITSWEVSSLPDESAIPEGETMVKVMVVKENISLDEAVEKLKEDGTNQLIAETPLLLESNLSGMLVNSSSETGPTRTLIVNLNDSMVYITAYGDQEQFMRIALSMIALK